MSSQFQLLRQRRFAPFFATQFLGAFNDNLFKQTLLLLVAYHGQDYTSISPALLTNLAAGLFILPFVLFSALAGQLADKYDKTTVIRSVKAMEVAIMLLAGWGFWAQDIIVLLSSLFLMGCHSAFFGPAKYSLLPRVLTQNELVGGNALLEMGTFLAILLGTLAAGLLVVVTASPLVLTAALLGVALAGLVTAMWVPPTGDTRKSMVIDHNPLRQIRELFTLARKVRSVWLSLLGISWFWFFGAVVLSHLPPIAKEVLHGKEEVTSALLAIFSIAVAGGSLLCERLSQKRVEIGLVPFGSIGLSVFTADLYFALNGLGLKGTELLGIADILGIPGFGRVVLDLSLIGVFSGFFIVPLYALIQARAPKEEQSRIMAANNIMNAVFMVAAAGVAAVLLKAGLTLSQIILVCALLNAAVAIYIYSLVPEFLWRFVGWILIHTVYQLKVAGQEHIPEEGAAVIAPNHVSYVDALVLTALSPRPIRFVMDSHIFKNPLMGWLFRAMKAIPIASAKTNPELLEQAFVEIRGALQEGELVCIFPEGGLTRDGELAPLRPGILRILEESPVPVVPVGLSGLWESVFSRNPSARLSWLPRRHLVAVRAGAAILPPAVTLPLLREQILELKPAL